jgi:hypothetical protein
MMKKSWLKIVLIALSLTLALIANTCDPNSKGESVSKRGVVVYPSDLISLGAEEWISLLKEADLNLVGIHTDTRLEPLHHLKDYLESDEGKKFVQACWEAEIDIEFELHILQDLLPRDLFEEHPEYFRMDKEGNRQQKYNMCFSSERAFQEIEKSVIAITQWLKPTTNRYYFWTDDVDHSFCYCEMCEEYSKSEQALIYENRLLDILREINPSSTVAHLCYSNTLAAPINVKPKAGVFLEYAPIQRDCSKPLAPELVSHLKENLHVFPAETAHILEYWLDVSMFSGWKRDALVKVPCTKEQCRRDVALYEELGITSMTTFAAWINADYRDKLGKDYIRKIIREYGEALLNK